jgi:hypothetical protein
VLQSLIDALPQTLTTKSKIEQSSVPYLKIIQGLQNAGSYLTPRSFSIRIPKQKDGLFPADTKITEEQLFEQPHYG